MLVGISLLATVGLVILFLNLTKPVATSNPFSSIPGWPGSTTASPQSTNVASGYAIEKYIPYAKDDVFKVITNGQNKVFVLSEEQIYHYDMVTKGSSENYGSPVSSPIRLEKSYDMVWYGNAFFISDTKNGTIKQITGERANFTIFASGLNQPMGMALKADGTVYIADSGSSTIKQLNLKTAQLTTVAGNGQASSADGSLTQASFLTPSSLALDADGNLVVIENKGRKVRYVNFKTSTVTTIPNVLAADETNLIPRVAVDNSGNYIVSDQFRLKYILYNPNSKKNETLGGNGTVEEDGFEPTDALKKAFTAPLAISILSDKEYLVSNTYYIYKITKQ
ncbi:hypothetical protein HDU91_001272 [Kappamyces sp. JEL0680]|nr:hypothetical protein HDU91_001272 [Kappamyces sp. JEL0680]